MSLAGRLESVKEGLAGAISPGCRFTGQLWPCSTPAPPCILPVMRSRISTLSVGDLEVEVTRKSVRSIRIVIEPPEGRVRVSAPWRVSNEEVRAALVERLGWIAKHRQRMATMRRPPRLEYVEGESLRWFGRDLVLHVVPASRKARARLEPEAGCVWLAVREGADRDERAAAIEACWRASLLEALPSLAAKWEAQLGVQAERWGCRRMTSRWGSCNTRARRISLNLELARRPPACLEYVVVHELAHLLEPGHGPRFKAILDRALPDWRAREKLLASEAMPRE